MRRVHVEQGAGAVCYLAQVVEVDAIAGGGLDRADGDQPCYTVRGTVELIERLKGNVVGLAFLVELDFLKGRDRLDGRRVTSVIQY